MPDPLYPLYTDINSLPTNSAGKRRIKTWHVQDAFHALSLHLEILARALVRKGAATVAGSYNLDTSAKTITVQDAYGITLDGRMALWVQNESVDYSSAGAVKCLVVARADQVLAGHSYTDPETSETINESLIVARGRLQLIEGTATDYPSPALSDVVLGYLDLTASPETYTQANEVLELFLAHGPASARPSTPSAPMLYFDEDLHAPIWWDGSAWTPAYPAGATADRPTSPPPGFMFFDTDLGKPIWWDGSAWVDATGAAV